MKTSPQWRYNQTKNDDFLSLNKYLSMRRGDKLDIIDVTCLGVELSMRRGDKLVIIDVTCLG